MFSTGQLGLPNSKLIESTGCAFSWLTFGHMNWIPRVVEHAKSTDRSKTDSGWLVATPDKSSVRFLAGCQFDEYLANQTLALRIPSQCKE